MRISHIQLELCRLNPGQWVKFHMQATSPAQFGMGYERALRLAIHRFHKSDEKSARRYLEDLILRQQQKKKFMNRPRVEAIKNDLNSYVKWRKSSIDTVVDSEFLLQDLGNGFLTLGGRISRLDLTAGGYRAVLFGTPTVGWKDELRMPLIQSLVSEMYKRPTHELSVGFQRLDGSDLQVASYSDSEVSRASRQFRLLAEAVEKQSRNPLKP